MKRIAREIVPGTSETIIYKGKPCLKVGPERVQLPIHECEERYEQMRLHVEALRMRIQELEREAFALNTWNVIEAEPNFDLEVEENRQEIPDQIENFMNVLEVTPTHEGELNELEQVLRELEKQKCHRLNLIYT